MATPTYFYTYNGIKFDPMLPRAEDINIYDIAHALSMQCRYTGHSREFYSVAEHSVRVSQACGRADAMWGLLHDASEAYLHDIPSPLKQSTVFADYRTLETIVMLAVCEKFGLSSKMPPSVKRADKLMLNTEARDLLPSLFDDTYWIDKRVVQPARIRPLAPAAAEQWFLERFRALSKVAA